MEKMICLAGFGDNSSMFDPILSTELAEIVQLVPLDLPGFGAPPIEGKPATLRNLGEFVAEKAEKISASIVLAHSLSSIVASLAAVSGKNTVRKIISLEGNLTRGDAYFSATAAQYDTADEFRQSFLARLARLEKIHPMYKRYREKVASADENALWELGCDAHRFGLKHVPGEILIQSAEVTYLYAPKNLSDASRAWLKKNDVRQIQLPGATHWVSLFQPRLLAHSVVSALANL